MANAVDTALDALAGATYLGALVTAGTLKAVERRILNALTEPTVPVLGIVPSAMYRQIKTATTEYWHVDLLLMLCTRAKGIECDESITDLAASVMGTLNAFNVADAPGGVVNQARWDFWYALGITDVPVGAITTAVLRVEGPLKTP